MWKKVLWKKKNILEDNYQKEQAIHFRRLTILPSETKWLMLKVMVSNIWIQLSSSGIKSSHVWSVLWFEVHGMQLTIFRKMNCFWDFLHSPLSVLHYWSQNICLASPICRKLRKKTSLIFNWSQSQTVHRPANRMLFSQKFGYVRLSARVRLFVI